MHIVSDIKKTPPPCRRGCPVELGKQCYWIYVTETMLVEQLLKPSYWVYVY